MEYYNDNGNFFEAVMHGTPNLGPVDFLIGATAHADDQELYWKNQAKVSSSREMAISAGNTEDKMTNKLKYRMSIFDKIDDIEELN